MNVRKVVVVINFGLPDSLEKDEQQHGRAGRDRSIDALGLTLVQKSIVSRVRKDMIKAGELIESEEDDDGEDDSGEEELVPRNGPAEPDLNNGSKSKVVSTENKTLVRTS